MRDQKDYCLDSNGKISNEAMTLLKLTLLEHLRGSCQHEKAVTTRTFCLAEAVTFSRYCPTCETTWISIYRFYTPL